MGVWLILRAAHIVLALIWTGAQIFVAFFRLRATGLSGGRVMQALQLRRYRPTLLLVGAITVFTGLVLYGRMVVSSPSGWRLSGPAILFAMGGLAGIAALGSGWFVSRPAYQRLITLATALAGGTPTPEQQGELGRLRDRLRSTARWVAVLLLASVLTMSLAPFA
jgi:hypothetical protein